ncbi:c-type cytochrome [Desulfonatronovibrio magnus]|uniref:c-type cytochrome n=1 Tax=Desulfonatronovibrio magnus TaxID=698827 RepID=UPI0012FAA1F7|nr:cytochrome c [Desulfonatronovibrio magnus]
MKKKFTLILLALGLMLLLGVQPAMTFLALDGRALVAERCTTCHNLDRIERRFGQDLAFWESTVDRMLGKRNMLSEAERKAVLAYLINP